MRFRHQKHAFLPHFSSKNAQKRVFFVKKMLKFCCFLRFFGEKCTGNGTPF
jgi:hypothetical protein